jgi:small GTP-binding protein
MSKKNKKELDYLKKVITLGKSGVGKSCILRRLTDNTFNENTIATIGLTSILKEIKLKNGKNIVLKLIDTAGQEKYKALSKSYFKNVDAVLFIFSINNEKSFEEVKSWIDLFNENYNGRANIPQYIVGNKLDLGRKVSKDLVNEFINENKKYKYFETSAKENIGINELFEDLAENLYEVQIKENTKKKSQNIYILKNFNNKKRNICLMCNPTSDLESDYHKSRD